MGVGLRNPLSAALDVIIDELDVGVDLFDVIEQFLLLSTHPLGLEGDVSLVRRAWLFVILGTELDLIFLNSLHFALLVNLNLVLA